MKTTYYIECIGGIDDKHLYAYYNCLSDAKSDLVLMFDPNRARIVKLNGPYKYEGVHMYYITFDGKKFKRIKLQ